MHKTGLQVLSSILLTLSILSNINADTITVANKAPSKVFAACYRYQNLLFRRSITKKGPIYTLEPESATSIQHPSIKFGYLTTVIFSVNQADLKDNLITQEYDRIRSPSLDIPFIKEYFINSEDGVLKGHNKLEWAKKPIAEAINTTRKQITDSIIEPLLNRARKALETQPYYSLSVAYVRIDTSFLSLLSITPISIRK
jgi:hypothetical protein